MKDNIFDKQKQLAKEYAKNKGFDDVLDAGIKGENQYFILVYNSNAIKLGSPFVIKINKDFEIANEDDYFEIWEAHRRSCEILKRP